jgi:ferritin-like metal-binding protein YciE
MITSSKTMEGNTEVKVNIKASSVFDLFLNDLKDIYHTEKQHIRILPKMIEAAQSESLKYLLEDHLDITEVQVKRIEEIFTIMDESPVSQKNIAIDTLINEIEELLKEQEGSSLIDPALISIAQRIEHYEISAYATLKTYAEIIGNKDSVELLQATLDEEVGEDKALAEFTEEVVEVK